MSEPGVLRPVAYQKICTKLVQKFTDDKEYLEKELANDTCVEVALQVNLITAH